MRTFKAMSAMGLLALPTITASPAHAQTCDLNDMLINVSMNRFAENPIIEPSPVSYPSGIWTDNLHTLHQCVRRKDANSPYMMWYTGDSDHDYPRRIHLATSNDGINFTKHGVVLGPTPGNLYYWDGVQVHMPTVIWHNNQWMMWYVGHDNCGCPGWYTVGLATSPDGINWTKYGQVLPTGANPTDFDYDTIREPTVIFDPADNLFKMWYMGTVVDQYWGIVGYATSPDGINWTKCGPVGQTSDELRGGALKIGDYIYMFYNIGPNLGYSVSQNGIDWAHYPGNPIMVPQTGTWEHGYLQAPSLVYDAAQSKLFMYYNAFNTVERIGGAWTWFVPPSCAMPPVIELEPTSLAATIDQGANPPDDAFTVANSGGDTLNYTITIDDDPGWLSVNPLGGSTAGPADTITVTYDTDELPVGPHTAVIRVSDPAASNDSRTVTVDITVEPPVTNFIGDQDLDDDVDQTDFGLLQACISGYAVPQLDPACVFAHLDADTDVDSDDLDMLLACMGGANVTPPQECANN